MSISTYDQLKKTVIKYTHRNDLLDIFDTFLDLTEVDIRSNPQKPLKLSQSEKVSTTSVSLDSRYLAFPLGFQSSRKFSITIDDNISTLLFKTPDQLRVRTGTGTPCFFTVRNNQIEFDILPDSAYTVTLTYMVDLTPLASDNQTNDILTKYPTVYMYGCLKHAFIYVEDEDQAGKYDGLFSEAVEAANLSELDIMYPTQVTEDVVWAP